MFGATDNYNTEATERLHIDLAKHAFRSTNKRNFTAQMCRWLERREAVFWFATHQAWKQGTTYDARLRKRPSTSHAPVRVAKRPQNARTTMDALSTRYHISNFKDVLRTFLRTWHKLQTWAGYQTELPARVAAEVNQLQSIATWNHVTFSTPNTQTEAAPNTINMAYASAARRRFDTVLVQTDGEDIAGVGGLQGERSSARASQTLMRQQAYEWLACAPFSNFQNDLNIMYSATTCRDRWPSSNGTRLHRASQTR